MSNSSGRTLPTDPDRAAPIKDDPIGGAAAGPEGGQSAERAISARYVQFPPIRRPVLLPLSSRAAATAGVCVFGATRRSVRALEVIAYTMVSALGPSLLPGRRISLDPPMGPEAFTELITEIVARVGPIDAVASVVRPQASRPGMAMLAIQNNEPIAFIRTQPNRDIFRREARILAHLARSDLRHFSIAPPIDDGVVAGWEWIALDPLPSSPHRAELRAPAVAVAEEITEVLSEILIRGEAPNDVPATWVPMHGDLAPWNLRRVRGRRVLLDWESAAFGPPGADVTYYHAAVSTISRRELEPAPDEAVTYWIERVKARPVTDSDAGFNARLLHALAAMHSTRNFSHEVTTSHD